MHWKLSSYVYWLNSYPSPSDMLLTQIFYFTWKKSYDHARQHIKKQRHYFGDKGPSSQNHGFSSSHVWMWELGYKESWTPKNWCFWTVVLEKILKSPLDCKEIQPVYPKGDQSWIFIGRTDVEGATPIFWPPDAKNWLIGKDPDAGKDWRSEEKGTTEDEMVGWHHQLDGHEFWVSSEGWWWTGKPGLLQSMGSQRVGHDWATELTSLIAFPRINSLLSLGFCFCSCNYYSLIAIFNLLYLSQDFCLLRDFATTQLLLTAFFLCLCLLASPDCWLSVSALHSTSQKGFWLDP